eukprot:Opistho-1_new@16697
MTQLRYDGGVRVRRRAVTCDVEHGRHRNTTLSKERGVRSSMHASERENGRSDSEFCLRRVGLLLLRSALLLALLLLLLAAGLLSPLRGVGVRKLHHVHRHVVWPLFRAVVALAVLAEAEEDGVDRHLKHAHEAVTDKEPEHGHEEDGYGPVRQIGLVVQERRAHNARRCRDGHLAEEEAKVADRVDDGDARCVAEEEPEGLPRGRAERVAVHRNFNVRVPIEKLEELLEAPQAAREAAENELDQLRLLALKLPLDVAEDYPHQLHNRNDEGPERERAEVERDRPEEGAEERERRQLALVARPVVRRDAPRDRALLHRDEEVRRPQPAEYVIPLHVLERLVHLVCNGAARVVHGRAGAREVHVDEHPVRDEEEEEAEGDQGGEQHEGHLGNRLRGLAENHDAEANAVAHDENNQQQNRRDDRRGNGQPHEHLDIALLLARLREGVDVVQLLLAVLVLVEEERRQRSHADEHAEHRRPDENGGKEAHEQREENAHDHADRDRVEHLAPRRPDVSDNRLHNLLRVRQVHNPARLHNRLRHVLRGDDGGVRNTPVHDGHRREELERARAVVARLEENGDVVDGGVVEVVAAQAERLRVRDAWGSGNARTLAHAHLERVRVERVEEEEVLAVPEVGTVNARNVSRPVREAPCTLR